MATSISVQKCENLEAAALIWLDVSMSNTAECVDARHKLRTYINHLKNFDYIDACVDYIQSIPNDRVVLIVSDRFAKETIPRIHQLRQVKSIYVHCVSNLIDERWAKQFKKVKGLCINVHELVAQIQSYEQKESHNESKESLAFSIWNSSITGRQQSTTELNGQFLHSQLLIDCLIRMKSTDDDVAELLSLCKEEYKGNKSELDIVREFERDYSPDRALWWYTRQTFLYRILNKALRTQNINVLFLFRFFIRDIARLIEQHRCTSPIRVYRGQLMSTEELNSLKDSQGEFISINSFLSTSINRKVALSFLYSSDADDDTQRVLFEIDADSRLDRSKPFSDISELSYYPAEQELLMMIGSVFRLMSVNCDENQVWTVRVQLCSDNDHDLKSVFDHMKQTIGIGETTLLSLGDILCNMGKFDDAENYIQRLLKELPSDHEDIANCYYSLGIINFERCDYNSSLKYHCKALEIRERKLTPPHAYIARSHNWIGLGYWKKGEYQQALESYERALAIFQEVYTENHPDVAECFNNIGIIYSNQKKYSKALKFYQKSLSIREKTLPSDHPDLGETHNNLGVVYNSMGQYDLAVKHYNQSLKIKSKCLPQYHPSSATTLTNLGIIYEKSNQLQEALSCFEQAATIYHQAFHPTHKSVTKNTQHIQRVSSKLK